MKTFLAILGFVLGVMACCGYYRYFGNANGDAIHDTVFVNRDSLNVKDSIVYALPTTVDISLDSVSIDTVSTIINGKVISSRYLIKFKK